QKLGFQKFIPKRTDRFLMNGKKSDRKAVLDRDGNLEYYLEMPTNPAFQNEALNAIDKMVQQKEKDYLQFLYETPIGCKVLKARQIYVNGEGLIFPCCWTTNL